MSTGHVKYFVIAKDQEEAEELLQEEIGPDYIWSGNYREIMGVTGLPRRKKLWECDLVYNR